MPGEYDKAMKSMTCLANGEMAFMTGDFRQAEEYFCRAIEFDNTNCDAYHKRAIVRYNSGNMVGAQADYERILELDPDDAVAHENLGSIMNTIGGNVREAIRHLSKAIRLNPKSAGAFYNRGNAYKKEGDTARAISDYTQAVKLKPDHAWAYYNRGLLSGNDGDYERAYFDFAKAALLDPSDTDARRKLESLQRMGY
jgi:Flp pilus assembly protein TadD